MSQPVTVRLRAVAVALGVTAVVTLAAGCTTSPGAAAVVGNQRISTQALQQAVDAALKDPAAQQQLGADRPGFVRTELARLVNDVLVAHVASQQLQQAYQQNIDQFDQVHAAHILVKTKAQADQILAQVRRTPASFASLASRFSIDTGSKANGGDLGFAPHSQFVKPFADAVFAAKPGSFIEVQSQFGWHVVHVIAHRVTTIAEATPQLKASLLQSQQQALLQKALITASKQLGVHVNPRYGVWNPTKGSVDPAPASSDLSTPAATPAS